MAALTVCDELLDANQRIRALEEELESLRDVRVAAADRPGRRRSRSPTRSMPPPSGSKRPRRSSTAPSAAASRSGEPIALGRVTGAGCAGGPPIVATLAGRSCVARQEPYIPGALSILQGTVPGRVRGSGHMVPTYFRRELRDRALQRPSRLRTFLSVTLSSHVRSSRRHTTRIAGYPVRRGFAVYHERLWNTGSPAFAGDDGRTDIA